jgi:hypothetical protein
MGAKRFMDQPSGFSMKQCRFFDMISTPAYKC